MKYFTTLLLFVLFTFTITAQTFFPSPEDDPSWIVKRTAYSFSGPATITELTYQYGEVIDHCGLEYIEVLQIYTEVTYTVGYIRIDGPKVYALYDNNLDCEPGEALMYDFSLAEDQTVACGYNMSAQWDQVNLNDFKAESIFTQEIFGTERTIHEMKHERHPGNSLNISTMYWAEGIGSDINPFYSLACIGDQCEITDTLYQVFYGDEQVYQALSIIADVKTSFISPLQIYPTVFDQSVTVKGEELVQSIVHVYDQIGQTVYSARFDTGIEELDLGFLLPGLYFMKIQSADGKKEQVTKLIKH